MRTLRHIDRRTVLKTIGIGVVGSSAITGLASAHDPENRRHDSFTWAQGDIYEMLDAEPPDVRDLEPGTVDHEGEHESHRPIWLIASMEGTGVDGSEHSPHPNPPGLPIDHVVPIGGGGEFTAQWHITTVSSDPTNPFAFTNVDDEGTYLTSADAIKDADGVHTFPLIDPGTGEPAVFTCPVRPHLEEE